MGTTTHKITAPEQLECASETEISFIGTKNMRNFGKPPGLVPQ